MKFSEALSMMDKGYKVSRYGWNGKGMFLFLVTGNSWDFNTDVDGVEDLETSSFICMKSADNKLIPWLASQSDLLACDWNVIS